MASVLRQKFITREEVRSRRSAIFVFGDNMERKGFGGQAKAMRGEPNTVGIPTKWAPHTRPSAYFSDDCLVDRSVREAIDGAFSKLRLLLRDGMDIVIPSDGVGTGLADLPRRAPKLHAYIEAQITQLGKSYNQHSR